MPFTEDAADEAGATGSRPRLPANPEHFPPKWAPVRRRKCDQPEEARAWSDPVGSGRALVGRALRLTARTLPAFAVTLLGVTLVTFLIGRVLPIDPVVALGGDHLSQESYHKLVRELGLDKPLLWQYGIYLQHLAAGDLGTSTMTARPVLADIGRYFPATLELATISMVLGSLLGIPLGVFAALEKDRWLDHATRLICLMGYSVPAFWLGTVALEIFYVWLGWSAGPGRLDIAYSDVVDSWSGLLLLDSAVSGNWDVFANAVSHIVLPAAILGWFAMAQLARLTRSLILGELGKDYMIAGRALGMSRGRLAWRHALPNTALPLITLTALVYASLLEGTVLIETVFAWPGLGLYIKDAVLNADMNALLGGTLVVGTIFLVLNAASDLVGRILDPRTQ